VDPIDRVPVEALEVQRVGGGEDLPHGDAAARRWRHRDDVVPVVGEPDRFALDGLVVGEVRLGPDAAHRADAGRQSAGERAPIERVGAAGGDRIEGRRQVRLAPGLAGSIWRAVGLAEGAERRRHRVAQGRVRFRHFARVVRHRPRHAGHLVGVERVEDDALAGEPDRWPNQIAPLQLAELAVGVLQAADDAGDARGARADPAVGRRLAVGVEIHVTAGGPGRHLPIVDRGAGAVRQPDDHEPAAADVAGGRMRDAEGEGDRDGRVHGVAAALQDRDADVGRVRFRGRDRAAPSGRDALGFVRRRWRGGDPDGRR
jgi:hypothetical protein